MMNHEVDLSKVVGDLQRSGLKIKKVPLNHLVGISAAKVRDPIPNGVPRNHGLMDFFFVCDLIGNP